jgi:hypothetical protein
MNGLRSVRFSEVMYGYISIGEADPRCGARDGRASATDLTAELTILIDDLHRFLADPHHAATVTGLIECDALGGELPIEGGVFNLFVEEADPCHKQMRYRIFFRDSVGHPVTLIGVKLIRRSAPLGVWHDTSTLYTLLVRGHIPAGQGERAELVASGMLRLSLPGVVWQLTTFRGKGRSYSEGVASIIVFVAFFCKQLWQLYRRGAAHRHGRTHNPFGRNRSDVK